MVRFYEPFLAWLLTSQTQGEKEVNRVLSVCSDHCWNSKSGYVFVFGAVQAKGVLSPEIVELVSEFNQAPNASAQVRSNWYQLPTKATHTIQHAFFGWDHSKEFCQWVREFKPQERLVLL